jgi:hypothetical protein
MLQIRVSITCQRVCSVAAPAGSPKVVAGRRRPAAETRSRLGIDKAAEFAAHGVERLANVERAGARGVQFRIENRRASEVSW